jgi:hypothetical protein
MASNNNRLLIVGVVGGAAIAMYWAIKKQNQVAAAYAIAEIGEPPSLVDTILNKIPQAIEPLLQDAKSLEAAIKARGEANLKSWREATKTGSSFYSVGAQCFVTKNGMSAKTEDCFKSGAFLEGCNCG